MAAMRLRPFLVTLLIPCAAASAACGSGASAGTGDPDGPATVQPGAVFTLAPGQTARLSGGGLTVRFDGVKNDSRCPTSVDCVWAGDATVTVSVTAGDGRPAARELHVTAPAATTTAVPGYVVALVGLTPERHSESPVPPGDYRARLRVDKR
ncbi:hypothetical protein AGRA3207_001063 [Actinomadura graeca]|uniref:Lipoprotein n=1 Tax=Actinomadura graeca TaxID=2750812 RepID=A0ABX8QNK3_9ACTN|nr:hypothetical protein [Actinomadura graeca]QXJ20365.1 hypothetical protein AGRA3207_001063 [Actinomadura graeca]